MVSIAVFFHCCFVLCPSPKTTYSTCFLLYHIARHPDVQERVFQEALKVLPNYDSDEITVDKMANQLGYSKAVLKETFRLNPVSVGVGRTTNTDLILSGYNVPNGVRFHDHHFVSPSKLFIFLYFLPDDYCDTKLHLMSFG